MQSGSCAFIVIDSGFSFEILKEARVIAAWDLTRGRKFESLDYLDDSDLAEFAGDPMGHGTIVLSRLLALEPAAKLILVKAFDNRSVCLTQWDASGKIARPGWSDAYVWAQQKAAARGMVSVANCSFGGYRHAMDGSGWEAHQLGSVIGPGHVLVAAAGPGDGRAIHASLRLLASESKQIVAYQENNADYNLWFGLGDEQESVALDSWKLEARLNGHLQFRADSSRVPANIWNGRRQLTFRIRGSGKLEITISRDSSGVSDWKADRKTDNALRLDVWSEEARFANWISAELVGEPACFKNVIAVGLITSSYSPFQNMAACKPDLLLNGSDQVSFRIPEITVACGKLLESDHRLDSDSLIKLLGKFR